MLERPNHETVGGERKHEPNRRQRVGLSLFHLRSIFYCPFHGGFRLLTQQTSDCGRLSFQVKKNLPDYKTKLTDLATAIAAEGKIDVLLNVIKAKPTAEFKTVERRIEKLEKKEIAQCVRTAILDESLFEFDDELWEHISRS